MLPGLLREMMLMWVLTSVQSLSMVMEWRDDFYNDGIWHHCVKLCDGTTWKIYTDGQLEKFEEHHN